MIIVVATHFVKKSKVDAFKVLAAELVEETNKEKGCMEYALYKQDGKKPTGCNRRACNHMVASFESTVSCCRQWVARIFSLIFYAFVDLCCAIVAQE